MCSLCVVKLPAWCCWFCTALPRNLWNPDICLVEVHFWQFWSHYSAGCLALGYYWQVKFWPAICYWAKASKYRQRSLETRINLSADLYKLHPGKIDHFKAGWSVFTIFQNDVLYLGVLCTGRLYFDLPFCVKSVNCVKHVVGN